MDGVLLRSGLVFPAFITAKGTNPSLTDLERYFQEKGLSISMPLQKGQPVIIEVDLDDEG